MAFTNRFDTLCKEKGLTPSAAGNNMGFSRNTVSLWRNGKTQPKAHSLERIAQFFDVSTDYLLGKSNIRLPDKKYSGDDNIKLTVFGTTDIPENAWHDFERTVAHIKRKYRIEAK